jgi:hypothetical protein
VSFGVLSRGGIDADAGLCVGAVYTRFDAWGTLLVSAAQQAAQAGGYGLPTWAGGDGGNVAASGTPSACSDTAAACGTNADCCSNNCVSHDNGTTFLCEACNVDNPCDVGLACVQGVCVSTSTPNATNAQGGSRGGCAIAAPGLGSVRGSWLALGLGAAGLFAFRRRPRRQDRGAQPGGNTSSLQSINCRISKRGPPGR